MSTRYTDGSGPASRKIAPHSGEVTFPEAGAGEIKDLLGTGAPDQLRQGQLDGFRRTFLSGKARGFGQQVFVEQESRPFHIRMVPGSESAVKRGI